MDKNQLVTIIIGAIVAILGATGIVTADEGAGLSANAIGAATGIMGVVEIVRGVIARRKHKPDDPAGVAERIVIVKADGAED